MGRGGGRVGKFGFVECPCNITSQTNIIDLGGEPTVTQLGLIDIASKPSRSPRKEMILQCQSIQLCKQHLSRSTQPPEYESRELMASG